MAPFGAIYLDTNVFVIGFEAKGEVSELLSQIFNKIDERRDARLVTSEPTLSELLGRPIRENDEFTVAQYEGLISPGTWLEVFPMARRALTAAATLRAQSLGLKLPDAIHIATIRANDSRVLTGDLGSKGAYSLTSRVMPTDPSPEPLPVIRPDEPTLTSLLQSLAA